MIQLGDLIHGDALTDGKLVAENLWAVGAREEVIRPRSNLFYAGGIAILRGNLRPTAVEAE
jgi:hypothetical protein